MEKLDLHGKTGFIIGGTRGIGNAIAMRMAGIGDYEPGTILQRFEVVRHV